MDVSSSPPRRYVAPREVQTITKALSLISLVPKWAGPEASCSLHDFLEAVEIAALVGNWSETDRVRIAALKLTDTARQFYSTNTDLRSTDVTWETFKKAFKDRFKDQRGDQFNYLQLQTAKQQKGGVQSFADHVRALVQKIQSKRTDPTSLMYKENLDRMHLAAYMSGLIGSPGTQVHFRLIDTLEEAVRIAVVVEQAERKGDAFYVEGREGDFRSPKSSFRGPRDRHRERNEPRKQHSEESARRRKESAEANEFRCFECDRGHMARDCPTRRNRQNFRKPPDRLSNGRVENRRDYKPKDEPRRYYYYKCTLLQHTALEEHKITLMWDHSVLAVLFITVFAPS